MADGNQSVHSLKPVGGIGKKFQRKFKMGKGKRRGKGIRRKHHVWFYHRYWFSKRDRLLPNDAPSTDESKLNWIARKP